MCCEYQLNLITLSIKVGCVVVIAQFKSCMQIYKIQDLIVAIEISVSITKCSPLSKEIQALEFQK
jgi:hypothetical protein